MKNRTRAIKLGNVLIGGGSPIRVQSMTNTDTANFSQTFKQVKELADAGCEILRLSVTDEKALDVFLEIQSCTKIPLVADIHFDADLAFKCIEIGCAGIRINPGNIGSPEAVKRIILAARDKSSVIRIGVNAGSLEREILEEYGSPTAEALAQSALRWIGFFEVCDFKNFKVSVKSSDIDTMLNANRIVSSKTDAPLHIGVTEAGTIISGLIKSSIGLSKLLEEGIGDTIRISLSSDPIDEVIAGRELLKTLKLRSGLEVISCPTCGRVEFDVVSIAGRLEREFSWVEEPIKVAVMGCVVNGPGEAREADIGIAGGKDCATLFVDGRIIKRTSVDGAYSEICDYIRKRVDRVE